MQALAACPNIAVKISGIGIPRVPWSTDNNRAIVLTVIELFGPQRCMFASNFPVDSLCGGFDAIYGGFDTITRDFAAAERDAMFAGNAIRIYAIPADALRATPAG